MGLRIDIHLHTKRYSGCSQIDPNQLVRQAVNAGLHGLVITEHHAQWEASEIRELVDKSGELGFLLMAGFEYTSAKGDILIYGLSPDEAHQFQSGWPPTDAITRAHKLGAICVAAHPTRMGLGFDEDIFSLGLDAIEVASVNLREHEQRLAMNVAAHCGVPAVVASDAHLLQDVGRYAMDFCVPIAGMEDLKEAIKQGKFQVPGL